MNLVYNKSRSNVMPQLIDITSSKTSVYIRKDVVEVEETDTDGNKYIMYEYDEAVVTKDEYQAYLNEKNDIAITQQRADIDFIAAMNNIEL